jgi:predicted pyridoxine 5'-phosphate oxidase superfamily flavin-nucleotide-binding protein
VTDNQHSEWMGKNRKLTPAEVKEFLAEPVVARIATIDENGVPYVTPVWQEWDGEAFWIVLRERAAWGCAYQDKSERRHFVRAGQRDLPADHGAGEG